MGLPRKRLFVPGIFNDDWCTRAAKLSKEQGIEAIYTDYVGGIFANVGLNWWPWRLTGIRIALRDWADEDTDVYAHSHGVKRLLTSFHKEPTARVRNVYLLAGAAPNDCRKNFVNEILERGQIQEIRGSRSRNDKALTVAESWVGRALGFDDSGRTGFTHIDPAVRPKITEIWHDAFGHSDWITSDALRDLLTTGGIFDEEHDDQKVFNFSYTEDRRRGSLSPRERLCNC